MKAKFIAVNIRKLVECSLFIGLFFVVTGCPSTGFQLRNVSLTPFTWVDGHEYSKVIVAFTFNRSVMNSTLIAPGTVKIDLKSKGKVVYGVPGIFKFSGPDNTAAEVVFISDKSVEELIQPRAGDQITYTITIMGSDAGAGVVKDSSGEAFDGDADGEPGGNFIKVLERTM